MTKETPTFRGHEDPNVPPFPLDYMTQKQCWAYLRKEIEKEQINLDGIEEDHVKRGHAGEY